jgi:general secretion pathway protein L
MDGGRMIRTLVFVEDGSWLRLTGGALTRGSGLANLPPIDPEVATETIAVVPGEAVALHWVELPPLAPAQGLAAARLLAAEVSAGPVEVLHVALGPVEADGWRMLALVDSAKMQEWLSGMATAGVVCDRMLPSPLLLQAPEAGVAVHDDGRFWQARGSRLGFAAEPDLARLLISEAAVVPVDEARWLADLPAVLATPGLNLRQGEFTAVRRWQPDARRLRRLAVAGLALLGVILATELAATWRFVVAADQAEAQLADAARAVLPRGTVVTDPVAQVTARQAQLGGTGVASLSAPLFAALQPFPAVAVQSVDFSPATGLVVMMSVPAPAERDAIAAAMTAAGAEAQFGVPGEAAGVPRIELRVRPR